MYSITTNFIGNHNVSFKDLKFILIDNNFREFKNEN